MRTRLAPAILLAITGHAAAQATFRGLGDLPGGNTYSEGWGVSGDGRIGVGGSITGGGGFSQLFTAFAWDGPGGLRAVTEFPVTSNVATAASADGAAIVGWVDFGAFSPMGVQAFITTPGGGAQLIGDLPNGPTGVPRSYGRGVSADGSLVVCTGESGRGNEAFLYEVATQQMTPLGSLVLSAFGSFAGGISADGQVVVGTSYSAPGEQQAFRWTSAGGMVGLGFLNSPPGYVRSSAANGVSADGSVAVGESRSAQSLNAPEAFRWTQATGLVGLGDLPGGAFHSAAYAVSADGGTVVGMSMVEGTPGPFGGGSSPRAFIWDQAHGMRNLADVLAAAGGNLAGWTLQTARAVSADGRTIVGTGLNPDGFTEAWLATLPAPACYPNCDGSATPPVLNVADFICFLNRFGAGDPYANCDGSTVQPVLNVADFVCFTNAFAAGCR